MAGLIELMGGKRSFEMMLDSLFTQTSELLGEDVADVTGLIGQYSHGNEPDHNSPYLFNFVGQPGKTQFYTNKIINELYRNTPEGLCGNEDCGQMSAWYVFSSMGLYPVNPSELKYQFGSPLVQEAKVEVTPGKFFTIKAPLASIANKYIQKVTLNGKELNRTYITHQEIIDGGLLEFKMGNVPNKKLFQ